ncbi:hypothetical protein EH11_02025 [Bacillus subtilis]|nr:hypothetical protein EH11_02025 [Bacillus subtilis]RUS08903.1 hypothetical protein EFW59_02032 [Bacillus subtilis]
MKKKGSDHMAKSQAKKKREHRLRNGGRDVLLSRGAHHLSAHMKE